MTSTGPAAAPAGAVQVACWLDESAASPAGIWTSRHGLPSIVTVMPERKWSPWSCTLFPPASGPPPGMTEYTTGGSTKYMKPSCFTADCPSGFVIDSVTEPAACGGVSKVPSVSDPTVQLSTGTPPSSRIDAEFSPLPPIVTSWPPAVEPDLGTIDAIAGGATVSCAPFQALKPPGSWALRPSGFVRAMSLAPSAIAPVMNIAYCVDVILAFDTTFQSNRTVAPAWKCSPSSSTTVPPVVGPLLGLALSSVGGADSLFGSVNSNAPAQVAVPPSGLVTVRSAGPTSPPGVITPRCRSSTNLTKGASAAPNRTVAPSTNPSPVIARMVPPSAGPWDTDSCDSVISDTVDGGSIVSPSVVPPSSCRPPSPPSEPSTSMYSTITSGSSSEQPRWVANKATTITKAKRVERIRSPWHAENGQVRAGEGEATALPIVGRSAVTRSAGCRIGFRGAADVRLTSSRKKFVIESAPTPLVVRTS